MTQLAPTPADVIVCVHNSPEDVQLCVRSVLDTLRPTDRLIIVDDGSAPETAAICADFAAQNADQCHLIRRPAGSGFCKAANAGMRESTAESVVLLNSDTIVTGDWLDRLDHCLAANWQVGLASPLSNAGGWQSIPYLPGPEAAANEMRSDKDTLRAVHAMCNTFRDSYSYPVVEQLNGFCLAITRQVLDTIGLFDEESFPMGYGEESDFVLRAQDAGFLCLVAIDCFVFHAKTKSYTSAQRQQYNEAGQMNLRRLHGQERIRTAVSGSQQNPVLLEIRTAAKTAFAENDWSRSEADENNSPDS